MVAAERRASLPPVDTLHCPRREQPEVAGVGEEGGELRDGVEKEGIPGWLVLVRGCATHRYGWRRGWGTVLDDNTCARVFNQLLSGSRTS